MNLGLQSHTYQYVLTARLTSAAYLGSVAGWSEIPVQNIIAIVPTSSTEEHTVLYTAENACVKDGAQQSPFVFRLLTAAGLPKQLVDAHEASELSPWRTRHSGSENATVHVVVSTGSGMGAATAVWTQLVRPLLDCSGFKESVDYSLHFTASEKSITELTQNVLVPKAYDGKAQSILLLSGDGGIVDIVNGLLTRAPTGKYEKPCISLLPLGTGNAMANSAGITGDSTLGLRTALRGSQREVPLFRAEFSPGARLIVNEGKAARPLNVLLGSNPVAHGAVVCSWGLHATLVADSDTTEYRKFGAARFKMAAKEALFPSDGSLPHAYKGKVSILRPGDEKWETLPRAEHGYILATLVSHMEAGFTISPASKPLDGKLRLVQFGHLNGQEATEIMRKAYQGGHHVDDDRVGYEEIEGLRIEFNEDDARWRRVCIDGKIVRVENEGMVEVRGGVEGVIDLISSGKE